MCKRAVEYHIALMYAGLEGKPEGSTMNITAII